MEKTMDIHEIKNFLPHRYPFLLIDRVTEVNRGGTLKGYKNITFNEPFFQGHFPYRPVMPGVLIVEAMAQACAILAAHDLGEGANDNRLYYFTGIDSARFKRPVEPGDRLDFEVTILRRIKNMWKCSGEAKVGDQLCCAAQLMFTYKDMS